MYDIFSPTWSLINIFSENAWLSLIDFTDSSNFCQDLLFPFSYKPRKNLSLLADTASKKPDFLGLSNITCHSNSF